MSNLFIFEHVVNIIFMLQYLNDYETSWAEISKFPSLLDLKIVHDENWNYKTLM